MFMDLVRNLNKLFMVDVGIYRIKFLRQFFNKFPMG